MAEAKKDLIAHYIEIEDHEDHFKVDDSKSFQNLDSFFHFETVGDSDGPAFFTARFRDVAFFHAATAKLP